MSLGINTKSTARRTAGSAQAFSPVDRPVFITGLGRSGTTIIHTVLSTHPNVNWMSLLCARYPRRPSLNRWLMRAIDVPVINLYLKRRFVPLENYPFWDHYFGGFGIPCRDLFASDVDVQTAHALQRVFGQFATAKRSRALVKITGCPRIGFLHAIFPDAKFIHVTRDGRAVANSRMKARFWKGWEGWRGLSLWADAMPAEYAQEWKRHAYSFTALAGIEWKAHLDQMEEVRRKYPDIGVLEVKYEDFCQNPVGKVREMAEFCELPWSDTFEAQLREFYIESENSKWQRDFTEEQQAILQDVLAGRLLEQGYAVAGRTAAEKSGDGSAVLVVK